MAAEHLGTATCPLCGLFGARVSMSKNKLACMTCNSAKCRGMQLFARSVHSDELLRDLIGPEPEPAPEPAEVTRYEEQRRIAIEAAITVPTPPAPPPASGGGLMSSWFAR